MGRVITFVLVNLGAYLVLRRLWPGIRAGRGRGGFWALAVLACSAWALPVLFGLGFHGTVPRVGAALKLFSSAWLIAALLVMLGGLPFALLRGRGRRAGTTEGGASGEPVPPEAIDMDRRRILTTLGRGIPVAAMATGVGGVVSGSTGFVIRREEMRLRDLPGALDGFTIGQITDVHVGAFIDVGYVRRAVEAMNEANVDLQVMTGDLIDDLSQLDGTMEALAACRARHGMLAVLGNHEHWRGLRRIRAAYAAAAQQGAPVRLLVDGAHVFEHAGQRVRVVGVDYPIGARARSAKQERMRRSAELAFRDTSPDEVVLCLTHHPDFFPLAAERGARLTLAGHTHGGQVALLRTPVFRFAFEYMLGRYRRGDSHLYVSGGTGHWLPFRMGVPPEVTLLTLRAV